MTAATRRGDGFGLGYRIRWWIEYGLMHVLGPAQLDEARDPRARMRREYARRKSQHERQQRNSTDRPTSE
ncbi:hypothetical protein [Microlunatus parietis]|uniref:Uncharacterized protein n=1 Tax=Microlunatus parietis TaxID=682979 RepID=A0A7Y9LAK0_9ACTN|nr:hypothetical protein [Microlunatus parietis]NYE68791.1 hypothetical protein [Microlunatus parietis]